MRFKGGVGISAEKRVVGIDIISKRRKRWHSSKQSL
jgi:hypothetical protein